MRTYRYKLYSCEVEIQERVTVSGLILDLKHL